MKNLKKLSLLLVASLMFSCGVKIDKARVSKVKSMAVVGFKVSKEKKTGLGGIVSFAKNLSKEKKQETANKFYDHLSISMGKILDIKVLNKEELTSNKYYKELYKANSSKGMAKASSFIGKNEVYECDNLLMYKKGDGLTAGEKKKLMKSLGVDALMSINAFIYPGKTSGIGPFKFVSYRVTLAKVTIYDGVNSEEKILDVSNIAGKVGKTEGLSISRLSDKDKEYIGLTTAIDETIKKLEIKIKKAK